MEQVKMLLFARWIATNYADVRNDSEGNVIPDDAGISVLNTENGEWWKKQLIVFEEKVYPDYIKNGSVNSAKEFLADIITKKKRTCKILMNEKRGNYDK